MEWYRVLKPFVCESTCLLWRFAKVSRRNSFALRCKDTVFLRKRRSNMSQKCIKSFRYFESLDFGLFFILEMIHETLFDVSKSFPIDVLLHFLPCIDEAFWTFCLAAKHGVTH